MAYLSAEQVTKLLEPIPPGRVARDGKGFSHVQQQDIRRYLTRFFGFARWDGETSEETLVFETPDEKGSKQVWTVAYRCRFTLRIKAPDGTPLASYSESAVGDATNQPSRADAHDLALKTAQSQAMKRCAANLGDQFGLSLYFDGTTDAVVLRTLVPGETSAGGVSATGRSGTPAVQASDTPAPPADSDAPGPSLPPAPAPEPSLAERAQSIADRARAVPDAGRGRRTAITALAVEAAKFGVAKVVVGTGGPEDMELGQFLDRLIRQPVPA